MKDGLRMKSAPCHSRFDQSLPKAVDKAKPDELAIAQEWENGVQKEVPRIGLGLAFSFFEQFLPNQFFLYSIYSFFLSL
jgi:hypothetical protein